MRKKSSTVFIFLLLVYCFLGSQIALGYSTLIKNDEKVIYLTFDDGPSVMTDKVLDILH